MAGKSQMQSLVIWLNCVSLLTNKWRCCQTDFVNYLGIMPSNLLMHYLRIVNKLLIRFWLSWSEDNLSRIWLKAQSFSIQHFTTNSKWPIWENWVLLDLVCCTESKIRNWEISDSDFWENRSEVMKKQFAQKLYSFFIYF